MENTKGKLHYAWLIVIAGCFLQGGSLGITFNAAGVFLQPVADSIGCGRGDLALYMTLMAFVTALTMPLVGKWLPTKNINILLTAATVICAIGYMLMSTYTHVWQWYITSVIMGASSAFLWFVPVPTMIRNWFAKKQGLAMGLATAFSGIGGAIFSPIFSNLIANVGWRKTYLIGGVISLILTVPFTLFVVKFKPEDIGMKPYGYDENAAGAKVARSTSGMSVERAAKNGLIVMILLIAGVMSLATSFSQHMSGLGASVGLSITAIGLIASCSMLGNVAGKLILGSVNDKFGVKTTITVGFGLVIMSCILMLVNGGNPVLLYAGAFFYGWGMSLTTICIPLIAGQMFGNKDFTKLYSYATMGNSIIGSCGITICGKIYDAAGSYYPAIGFVMAAAIIAIPLIYAGLAKAKKVGFDD